ncbi:MAG TPA: alcohol dehydrogenase [Mariniphaga anaerophila]|uniref:Alcohol dehydrogenase n=1 Tax=Mariniphaga anaerophila TaxID=1484053 RepID=A0A831LJJ6_9BACT|nr:alcohol dehydrogenase [Mariniphaga anaerophila]
MKKILFGILLVLFVSSSYAQLVQWRGPNRDGHFPETGLLKEWPENGPEILLEAEDIGKGWSSPILVGDMIYVTGMIDTLDYLTAMDLKGNVKWQVSYGRAWNQSFPDTRSTPVVEDERIYVQSGTGRVVCLNRDTGKEIWAVDVDDEFETEYGTWGNSETPLIVDDKIISTPAGPKTSVVALDKMTGEPVWQTESLGGPRAYASATIYEYNDFRYILAMIGTHLLAIHPETGELAWHYKYLDPEKWDREGLIWANTPIFKEDEIFLSMGYDYHAVMLKMDSTGTSVSEKFIDRTLDNHHHGVVIYEDHIYGSNWYDNRRGRWVCMVWDTGEIKYVDDWDTKGVLIMADGMFYAYNERGTVGLVKPGPSGFEVVSEFRITKGSGPHWAHPFISDGKLLLRHGEVLMVFDIKED